ncbi:MAG: cobyric acid synthase [Pseudomonadota bacterium]
MATHQGPPAVMVQGAGSNVGKSLIVAGLCRVFSRRGLSVRPFKPQNMSNNAAATPEGGEIGRAQALQARACGAPPSIHMNPVLLKPETDTGSQIIVQGQRFGTMRAREFGQRKSELLPAVMDSYAKLAADADMIIIEGAGSPAEVNLRAGDIANMGFAEASNLPVIIAGDIERGGVIANLVGTHAVLPPSDRDRIKAFIVNKFRGDVSLFDGGMKAIADHTGWSPLGVIPFFSDARLLPAEDILDLDRSGNEPHPEDPEKSIKIVVPVMGRIANYDDLDPLKLEPGVDLVMAHRGRPLPRDADLIILPGSKSTVGDLIALREEGWDIDIAAHIRQGGHVLGLCGGYQILGKTVDDPDGIEGHPGCHHGLGHLDVTTKLLPDKVVRPVTGQHLVSNEPVIGYEIHIGRTDGPDCSRPVFKIEDRETGASSTDGRIIGTYVHGVFGEDGFRRAFLNTIRRGIASDVNYEATVEHTLNAFADHLEQSLDLEGVREIAQAKCHSCS